MQKSKSLSNEDLNVQIASNDSKCRSNTLLTLKNSYQTNECLILGVSNALLTTAVIYVKGINETFYPFHCILDNGSEISLITQEASEVLGLNRHKVNSLITGLNGAVFKVKSGINAQISNSDGEFQKTVNMLIVPKITDLTPSRPIDINKIQLPQNIKYANPNFYKPQRVQILLGGDVFYDLLLNGQIKLQDSSIILQNTRLGWVVAGTLNDKNTDTELRCHLMRDPCEFELKAFWELEELGIKDDPNSATNDSVVEKFHETVSYKDNRYEIRLPWVRDWTLLKNNYKVAETRLKSLIKRMKRDPNVFMQYRQILDDYLNQDIIELVSNIESSPDKPVFYLPHHTVLRQDSLYTKCRIVFDASSHEDRQLSLNDCLDSGCNLNPNIFHLLVQFRLNKIAILADIEKAFLQILINAKDRDVLRFLFIDNNPAINENYQILVFKFKRLTFGLNASPFLLSATIKKHVSKFKDEYPSASRVLNNCLYVDDLVTGADTVQEALIISQDCHKIMKEASMNLRKWVSNDESLMQTWENLGLSVLPQSFNDSSFTKVLGLSWNPNLDILIIDIDNLLEFLSSAKNTKRAVLQAAGRVFDPLGLISPYTIRFKCMFQEMWHRKLAWDEELPPDISKMWEKWTSELPQLKNLHIPRNIVQFPEGTNYDLVLHIFSDASPKAYGAVVYLQVNFLHGSAINLVTSKSRVAPLKKVSLPRLELLGALLAARLANEVKRVLDSKASSSMNFYTDSQITLYWIKGSPNKWKSFVANRVREIQSLTDTSQWYHCPGSENPADLLTRGSSAETLVRSSKWFRGPDFITLKDIPQEFNLTAPNDEVYKSELKKDSSISDSNCVSNFIIINDSSLIDNILSISNDFVKLIRITSFIFRFIFNCQHPREKRIAPFTAAEYKKAELFLIKSVQQGKFKEEIARLEKGEPIPGKSKLNSLNVFLDEDGLIRVRGRLSHSDLHYNAKFPVVLPRDHPLTMIILRYFHLKYFHLGPTSLLYHVRQKFWPLNGRNNCRKIVHECVSCFKNNPVPSSQKMGDLPRERVTPNFPFLITGLDYCGPFSVKFKNQRKGILNKIYVVVYVCLSTKAIHLDFVTDMTTQAFIASLKRFFGRRGKCAKLMSDNSKTFIGADIELRKLAKLVSSPDENLSNFLAQEGISWEFIPPKSPNFGGIWEAGVKSFKFHLKRVIGNQNLTLEEFLTVLSEIEGVLNSRPLTPLSPEFDNFETLTPGHFLIGRAITSIVEPVLLNINENRLARWQKIAKFTQRIWSLWKRDYLNNLQERTKWKFSKDDVKEGALVLVKQENLPSTKWLVGRISQLFKGKDNLIRVVDLQLPDGKILKRNVRDICILPVE